MKTIAIVGAGFAGAVMARELAETGNYRLVVFDERNHVAGNCHTTRDGSTGVLLHQYGPHIFHTNREDVWEYVQRFAKFGAFTNRVKAVTAKGVFSLPINLLTINQFYKKSLDPQQARAFLSEQTEKLGRTPVTFEEQALSMIGRELYENFFLGYTRKQWGVDPTELPASILQRLPVRFDYNDNYYASRFQGIPLEGYTQLVDRILAHPAIEVRLGQTFSSDATAEFAHTFYSGPLDAYFSFRLGRLAYRSLRFERFEAEGDFQGNPVLNYCDAKVPFTRITEHKHFAPWEEHAKTVCFREFSKAQEPGDVPYYPVRLSEDKALLSQYVDLAEAEPKVTFIGRLGTYRYLDMHAVIGETLDLAKKCAGSASESWPTFSADPLPKAATQKVA